MSKTLILIPGFGESTHEKPYKTIKNFATKAGIKVIEINPVWDYKTMSDWYTYSKNKIKDVDIKNTVIIGFSLGAYISILLSREHSFNKSIFCSLSPFFKEQLNNIPAQAKSFLGKRRMNDFTKHSLNIKSISKKNILLFGDKDWGYAISEAKRFAVNNNYVFNEVKDVGHELNEDYINAIIKYV